MKREYVVLLGAPTKTNSAWFVMAPQFPVTTTSGDTRTEALKDIVGAIQWQLEDFVEDNLPFPAAKPPEAFEDDKTELEEDGQSWEFVWVEVDLDAVKRAVWPKLEKAATTIQKYSRGKIVRSRLDRPVL